jgi:hypothetical protein
VSFLDNMMNPNPKQNSSKYNTKSSQKAKSAKSEFPEEVSEDFSARSASDTTQDWAHSKQDWGHSKKERSFKEEFSDSLASEAPTFGIQTYSKAGVTFEKLSETQARINYNGLLAKSGAQQVYGVYGFGSNQNWENVSTIPLSKSDDGVFYSIIPVEQGKNLNLAFKDPADNWDNNSGMNYTFVN